MRIALFTETYLPEINGVATYVKSLKEGLEKLGHSVLIVTANAEVKEVKMSNGVLYCPAVKLKKIYDYSAASPISVDRLKYIREFAPQIIHIHNEFGIGLSGVMIAKLLRIPLVYTLHTMYDDYVYYVANKHLSRFITGISHQYAKILAETAGAIIGSSKKVEEYFKNCGVKKKMNVAPNPVETEKFNRENVPIETVKKIRKNFGFREDDFVLCFCGRLAKEKNIDFLIRTWAGNVKAQDKLKLLIIGGGPFYEEYVNETVSRGVEQMIKFSGAVNHDDIPPYYAACDCYVTASLSENYSISFLEAMSMRLPVLHIYDELNQGQMINGKTGFIYNDESELYALMIKMRDMTKSEYSVLCESTYRVAVEHSETEHAKDIIGIYKSVIKDFVRKRKIIRRRLRMVKLRASFKKLKNFKYLKYFKN